jgi:predicted RNA-binding protein YlxR (DUF448 family)
LLRIVAAAGELVPDPRRRLPGRGAWLHPDPGCLATARKRRAFGRALRVRTELDVTPVLRHLGEHPGVDRSVPTAPGGTEEQGNEVDPS